MSRLTTSTAEKIAAAICERNSEELNTPSAVVQLLNVVYEADLIDDKEAVEVQKAIQKEAAKFGSVRLLIFHVVHCDR